MKIHCQHCSQLVKVFMDQFPSAAPYREATALQGEVFSYQIAIEVLEDFEVYITAETDASCDLLDAVRIRQVTQMPVMLPNLEKRYDNGYERTTPGFYPDLLSELREGNRLFSPKFGVLSLWITVTLPRDCRPGRHEIPIKIHVVNKWKQEEVCDWAVPFILNVLPVQIPEQDILCTMWFHSDCIATYYNIPVFSEIHWKYIENFMKSAYAHGIRLLLTPVFTPPLDTKVGIERPTVQLVKVIRDNGVYSFDFSLLKRWVDMARAIGFKWFEISHLFTQWGAHATPKIIATVDGVEKRIFGWDVASDSKEYSDFLSAFLPQLTCWLNEQGLGKNVYFHCSDEPNDSHIDSYTKAVELMRKYLDGYKIMDALSDVKFYKSGAVRIPVPCEPSFPSFLEAGVSERWIYYCCGPANGYCNRLTAMKSVRNRDLGLILYYYDIKGFLQWAFNFYYAALSEYPIDPYKSLDADGRFPSGDSFIVYPGPNGIPEDSIRGEVFYAGLQDVATLKLLETKMPREEILREIDASAPDGKFAVNSFPQNEADFLALRQRIDSLLTKYFPVE